MELCLRCHKRHHTHFWKAEATPWKLLRLLESLRGYLLCSKHTNCGHNIIVLHKLQDSQKHMLLEAKANTLFNPWNSRPRKKAHFQGPEKHELPYKHRLTETIRQPEAVLLKVWCKALPPNKASPRQLLFTKLPAVADYRIVIALILLSLLLIWWHYQPDHPLYLDFSQ